MMRRFHISLLLPLAMLATACGRQAQVYWSDGNFEVYATDVDSTAMELGYNHHPGTLGLVKAQVVAAGGTEDWVFVERLDRVSGLVEFYVVPKERGAKNHSGTVEGPFSETQFRDLRATRNLPEFAWRTKG